MKPKEQADQMVNEYRMILTNENTECGNEILCTMIAVKCVLVAVREILNIVPSVYITNDEEIHSGHYQYWQEVEQEIENYEQ